MSGNNNNDDEEKDKIVDNTTTKFLHAFTEKVLNSDKSIRWVAITDQEGIILNEQNKREEMK
jgi:hypothetical protein